MKLIGKSMVFGLCAAAAAMACSSGHAPSTTVGTQAPAASGGTGDIGLALTLPGGEHITTLSYSLSNGGAPLTGSYNIGQTGVLSFTIGSVPAGSGYRLQLTATTDDKTVTCSYPAADVALTTETPFSVLNRTTTTVNVNLQCVNVAGQDSGSLIVNAVESACPVWNTIVANPENITLPNGANVDAGSGATAGSTAFYPNQGTPVTAVLNDGQSLVLVGSATAPNPGALAFNWTTTGGTLSSAAGTLDPNSTDAGTTNQTVFTCPSAPNPTATYTVTLTLSDGFDAAACDANWTTGTVSIECSNPAPCGGAPYASSNGGVCNVNGTSTPATTDANGFPYVTTGATDPSNPGDFCCAGACGDGSQLEAALGLSAPATPAQALPSGGTCAAVSGHALLDVAGCCLPLLPCTTGTSNCVQCGGNTSGLCTPTEAAIVQVDISKGVATAPGADPAGCYTCLDGNDCLDDSHGNSGNECGDALSFGTSTECLATLNCIIGSNCDSAGAISICYCGTAPASTTCASNPSAENGSCAATIAAGLFNSTTNMAYATTDGTDILPNLTNNTMASGMADQIFQCGHKCASVCQ